MKNSKEPTLEMMNTYTAVLTFAHVLRRGGENFSEEVLVERLKAVPLDFAEAGFMYKYALEQGLVLCASHIMSLVDKSENLADLEKAYYDFKKENFPVGKAEEIRQRMKRMPKSFEDWVIIYRVSDDKEESAAKKVKNLSELASSFKQMQLVWEIANLTSANIELIMRKATRLLRPDDLEGIIWTYNRLYTSNPDDVRIAGLISYLTDVPNIEQISCETWLKYLDECFPNSALESVIFGYYRSKKAQRWAGKK